jgi:hypoxanthine phosphoribosyltransferase
MYTSAQDKYTWRACEPEKLRRLAATILAAGKPDLLLAAAHGAIMPALLLAEYLDLPLYFVRFSMFKRRDEEPILSLADEAWLAAWSRGYALLFDEDVAGGTTLLRFSQKLGPFFATAKTACVIRHAGARLRPDFVGRVWFD